ncbi:hypothetical protein A9485_08670 [Bacillus cereus]|uniref:hypothetical protein n=1 Tax=Bacillus cereus TaxID=1396 RepID=UPI0008FE7990|nr:hypothetical protein [Bacillus cereus]OJD90297.1 hypothetical protein A9485_08670 [Bacillus cereus]
MNAEQISKLTDDGLTIRILLMTEIRDKAIEELALLREEEFRRDNKLIYEVTDYCSQCERKIENCDCFCDKCDEWLHDCKCEDK